MSFNKHFVFHNLNVMSKKINEQTIDENALEPLFITLNRIQFSHLESSDAKRLLDSIDFKVSPDLADKITKNSHYKQSIKLINEANPALIDDFILAAKKMGKDDSFSTLWTNSINSVYEVNLLNRETTDIKPTRRPSLSM